MRGLCAIALVLVLSPLTLVASGGQAAAAERQAPPVKHVVREYGDGPVRLAAHQGTDVSFHARRGDRVTVIAESVEHTRCSGRETLVDGRGARTAKLGRVFRVRTTGAAVLRFRGRCGVTGTGKFRLPVRVEVVKVRMRKLSVDGPRTRVRAPRQGFLDVAFVRVPRTGRVKLTLRDQLGQAAETERMLVGSDLKSSASTPAASIEPGQRMVLSPYNEPHGARLRRGKVIGLVAGESGYAEALRARESRVTLDGPRLTLPAEPGREYILTYEVGPGERVYLDDQDSPTMASYAPGDDRDNPALKRIVVAASDSAAESEPMSVRVRRLVQVADLAPGADAIRFESADPGQWFVARIPATTSENVRLSATDVTVAGGSWYADVPPVGCLRDCYSTGLHVWPERLMADGRLPGDEPYELVVRFGSGASGGVSMTLTDLP